jgi:hypothetical protein
MASLLLPVGISIALTIIMMAVLLGAALFFDFVKDSWKLPLAIGVDIIDFVALFNPGWLDIAAAATGFFLFLIVARSILRYPGALIVGVEGFVNVGTPAAVPGLIGQVAGLLPINTILMFVDCIID